VTHERIPFRPSKFCVPNGRIRIIGAQEVRLFFQFVLFRLRPFLIAPNPDLPFPDKNKIQKGENNKKKEKVQKKNKEKALSRFFH
jgi:hypothetical protein